MSQDIPRCSKCILPRNFSGIRLNDKGVCSICAYNESVAEKQNLKNNEQELISIFERHKNSTNAYDCLVPISGGKDSAFVLYFATKRYKLKTLAFHFDNGFVTRQAYKNIQNMVQKSGADLISIKLDRDMLFEAYKIAYKHTRYFCYLCNKAIGIKSYNIAKEKGIPLILWGLTRFDIGQTTKEAISLSDKFKRSKLGRLWNRSLYYLKKEAPLLRELSRIKGKDNIKDLLFREKSGMFARNLPIKINPLLFIDFSYPKMLETIKTEFGWDKGPDSISEFHSDCVLHQLIDYCKIMSNGFGDSTVKYSHLIRFGQITREEALKKAEEEKAACNRGYEYIRSMIKDTILGKDVLRLRGVDVDAEADKVVRSICKKGIRAEI